LADDIIIGSPSPDDDVMPLALYGGRVAVALENGNVDAVMAITTKWKPRARKRKSPARKSTGSWRCPKISNAIEGRFALRHVNDK
jgi:hypothetical protein